MGPRAPSTTARGAAAEERAARYLGDAGYVVLERNFRCKAGELDLVATEGDVLAFVEVRSRADDAHGGAAEMVGRDKQRRVIRAARGYLNARAPAQPRMRFDVVAITGDELILVRDAFRVR